MIVGQVKEGEPGSPAEAISGALMLRRSLTAPNRVAERRREIVDATLEALWHTVGRDEHMPHLKRLIEGQVEAVTFAEIAEALASVDVSCRDPDWRADWAEFDRDR